MSMHKGTFATISIIVLVAGIIGGALMVNISKEKEQIISATPAPANNEILSPTATPENSESLNSKYNPGDIVDIAKEKLTDLVVTVEDSFMDADGHSYEIYNQQVEAASSIVIHLNKEFSTLKYDVLNKAIITGSGSEGTSVISESTKDGETIGDPILSTTVPVDQIYPLNVEVDVTGLEYVVIVDLKQNLQAYNFDAIVK